MTNEEKNMVIVLRQSGKSAREISIELSISINTIKSFLKRKNIKKERLIENEIKFEKGFCKNCGKKISYDKPSKTKLFCSDLCRHNWWGRHLDEINKKAFYDVECLYCHKKFKSYGNNKRKYCSHSCYIKMRFKNEKE